MHWTLRASTLSSYAVEPQPVALTQALRGRKTVVSGLWVRPGAVPPLWAPYAGSDSAVSHASALCYLRTPSIPIRSFFFSLSFRLLSPYRRVRQTSGRTRSAPFGVFRQQGGTHLSGAKPCPFSLFGRRTKRNFPMPIHLGTGVDPRLDP